MQPSESTDTILTLLGAGPATIETVAAVSAMGAILVAVDGGVVHAEAIGRTPDLIIGDLDSQPQPFPPEFTDVPQRQLVDQDSTDFDKALRSLSADLYLCAGFLGGRVDHTLACFHTLLRHPDKRVILVSDTDVVALLPPTLQLELAADTRVSLFPLRQTRARSHGLRWPLDDLDLAPASVIATSNAALGGAVMLEADSPGLLLIVPRGNLAQLAAVIRQTPAWSLD